MSTFWSIWISVIVLGSIFGLCWLLHATRKSQPNTTETTETTGHAYDGIQEYDNRSEEHTSELQSRENLVCRLLLEKKKKQRKEERRSRRRGKNSKKELRGERARGV